MPTASMPASEASQLIDRGNLTQIAALEHNNAPDGLTASPELTPSTRGAAFIWMGLRCPKYGRCNSRVE